MILGGAALLTYTIARTLRPLPKAGDHDLAPAMLAFDLAVVLATVIGSGRWSSPYVLALLVPVVLAGLSLGYGGALGVAGAATGALAVASVIASDTGASTETTFQVAVVFGATAVVAGYARRLFLEAEASQAQFADRVSLLTETNELLAQLTHAAQTLPSSLDLGDTLSAAMGHLRQLFDFTGAAILVADPATGTWRPESAAGLPAPAPFPSDALPAAAAVAVGRGAVITEPALEARSDGGLWPGTRSGLYCPLQARNHLVALVALEHEESARYGAPEADLLAGLAEPLALAIDNALFFDRLRMLGADAERDRLARNLHDRVGQGLAYINIELDRLSRVEDPSADLARLRADVTGLLGEVRETLRQLRSRVTDAAGFADLARPHVGRFAARTGLDATFSGTPGAPRLPAAVEQELWRILQEVMANVERHAGATTLAVRWACDGRHGRLEVEDDGCGFDAADAAAPAPASGLLAIRERANAIGARLVIDSAPGRGTRLVIEVETAALETNA